jgi:hypothetical protein
MIGRVLIVAGAVATVVGMFLTYFDLATGGAFVGDEVVTGETFTFWEIARAHDIALLALCVLAAGCAAAGLSGAASLAAACVPGVTVPAVVEFVAAGAPLSTLGAGMWVTGGGGAVAFAGALLSAGTRRAPAGRTAGALLVAGSAATLGASFVPYVELQAGTASFWQAFSGADVALLVLAVATCALVAARLRGAASVTAGAMGAFVVLGLVETLAADAAPDQPGAWALGAAGAVALAGAGVVLLQPRARVS